MATRKSNSSVSPRPSGLKIAIQLVILLFIVVSTIFAVQMVQRQQKLASFADLGDPSVNASMWFSDPSPLNPQTIGGTFTTNVMVNTGGQGIVGVDAHIDFDPTVLEVISVTPTPDNGFSSYPAARFKNDKGEISLSGNVGTGNGTPVISSALSLGIITFRVLGDIDTTSITYRFTLGNRNDTNVVPVPSDRRRGVVDILGSVLPLTVTTHPIPSPSPSPSPSSTPEPSTTPNPSASVIPSALPSATPTPSASPISVTLRIGLQGKYGSDIGNSATITATYQELTSLLSNTLTLVTDINGDTTTTLIPGNYAFLVKSPSYLKRKYGTLESPIAISLNSPLVDLSLDPLLGGDFNNDGIINEVDYTANFLPIFGGTDFAIDLDASGQVNNLDFAIMRSNWGLIDDTL